MACLNAFWLVTSYYLVMGAASWRERRQAHPAIHSRRSVEASPQPWAGAAKPSRSSDLEQSGGLSTLRASGGDKTPAAEERANPRLSTSLPRVALLYATCNDFREEGVEALLRMDWPHCAERVRQLGEATLHKVRPSQFRAAVRKAGPTVNGRPSACCAQGWKPPD